MPAVGVSIVFLRLLGQAVVDATPTVMSLSTPIGGDTCGVPVAELQLALQGSFGDLVAAPDRVVPR